MKRKSGLISEARIFRTRNEIFFLRAERKENGSHERRRLARRNLSDAKPNLTERKRFSGADSKGSWWRPLRWLCLGCSWPVTYSGTATSTSGRMKRILVTSLNEMGFSK